MTARFLPRGGCPMCGAAFNTVSAAVDERDLLRVVIQCIGCETTIALSASTIARPSLPAVGQYLDDVVRERAQQEAEAERYRKVLS